MSFLTPIGFLFVVAAVVPLAAFIGRERRAERVRRVFGVAGPARRTLFPTALALVVLAALVAVAAAQPVVIRQRHAAERADAQAFALLDTSLSMSASIRQGSPTRLQRAKALALRLERALPDVPFGIASMTDRSLPNLMPTLDRTLFERTLEQSVAIDRPPPSQPHRGRATTFDALVPVEQSNFYSQQAQRRLLIVFTDGESSPLSPIGKLTLKRRVTPIYVHVWAPGERIFGRRGRPDPHYVADPGSAEALTSIAQTTHGAVFDERDFGDLLATSREVVGTGGPKTVVSAYARVPLAPWFVLGAVAPLAFLLWRRNL